jgi:phosphomannomutase
MSGYLQKRGELAGNAVVATVMSNIGLELALRSRGIELCAPMSATNTCSKNCSKQTQTSAANNPATLFSRAAASPVTA